MRITVRDSTGSPICNATVSVRVGADTQTASHSGCEYMGPSDRSGAFTIDVTAPGYAPQTVSVIVQRGECGPITKDVIVTMTK